MYGARPAGLLGLVGYRFAANKRGCPFCRLPADQAQNRAGKRSSGSAPHGTSNDSAGRAPHGTQQRAAVERRTASQQTMPYARSAPTADAAHYEQDRALQWQREKQIRKDAARRPCGSASRAATGELGPARSAPRPPSGRSGRRASFVGLPCGALPPLVAGCRAARDRRCRCWCRAARYRWIASRLGFALGQPVAGKKGSPVCLPQTDTRPGPASPRVARHTWTKRVWRPPRRDRERV